MKPNKKHILTFALVFALIGGAYLLLRTNAASGTQYGDLNNDGVVNALDLSTLLSNWNTTNAIADTNSDGKVDILDLSKLLSWYGKSVPITMAAPPAPPAAYTLPPGATVVRNTSELISAVGSSTVSHIILEDGIYTHSTSLSIGVGHKLWARNLGGATLQFGLVLGGNSGTGGHEIHGLRFNVSNPALTLQGAAINAWGVAGQNVKVYDTWVSGNMALLSGILTRTPNGFVAQRVVVDGFTDYGIFFQTVYPAYYTDNPATKPIVTDANISRIYRTPRGASDGKAEAGLWAGVGCTCSRIKVRDTGWMGIWTGANSNDGSFGDIDIGDIHGNVPYGSFDPVGTGIYMEHYTRRSVFSHIHVHAGGGVKPRWGFVAEWSDPTRYAGTNPENTFTGGAWDIIIQDSQFDTSHDGAYLADATRTTMRRIKFVGQKYAAIRDYMESSSNYTTTHHDNTYQMQTGAIQYTRVHANSIPGYID